MHSSSRTFRRWDMPAGLAPFVMFGSDPEPGVYVLEFADGSEYEGQSIHPISRLATHRRRYKDIVAVCFTSVDRAGLDFGRLPRRGRRRRAGTDRTGPGTDPCGSRTPADADAHAPACHGALKSVPAFFGGGEAGRVWRRV